MPAKAGIQKYLKILDSRLRGNDAKGRFKTFYETINFIHSPFLSQRSQPPAHRAYAPAVGHSVFLIFLCVLGGLCERLNGPS